MQTISSSQQKKEIHNQVYSRLFSTTVFISSGLTWPAKMTSIHWKSLQKVTTKSPSFITLKTTSSMESVLEEISSILEGNWPSNHLMKSGNSSNKSWLGLKSMLNESVYITSGQNFANIIYQYVKRFICTQTQLKFCKPLLLY